MRGKDCADYRYGNCVTGGPCIYESAGNCRKFRKIATQRVYGERKGRYYG